MDRHETKARMDGQVDEWKKNLETMSAKAGAASGQARVDYRKNVEQLQKQFDELKVMAAHAWDVADDSWDSTRKDLELKWEDWEVRAKRAWRDLSE